jgi:hypothetical protein
LIFPFSFATVAKEQKGENIGKKTKMGKSESWADSSHRVIECEAHSSNLQHLFIWQTFVGQLNM